MRRTSKTKSRKSQDTEDPDIPLEEDQDETASNNDEALNANSKKRNARGRVKVDYNEVNKEDNGNEDDGEETAKLPKKKKKEMKKNDENDTTNNDDGSGNEHEETNDQQNGDDKNEEKEEKIEQNGSAAKGKKKGKTPQKKKTEEKVEKKVEDKVEEPEEYEVEKIVGERIVKGRKMYLVRWKGYSEDADTWEPEKDLNCDDLIKEFLEIREENEELENIEKSEQNNKPSKSPKDKKKKDVKKAKSQKRISKGKTNDANDSGEVDDTTEYEVERIIEVHFKKDKKREFLIRWKGFSAKEDTWEPEENLNCPDMIEKFMEKLDKIKSQESRELRANPSHTKRYTLTMYAEKRSSRRNVDKERKTYYECD